ncbi:MAG TPA: biotin/lipoyl-containing protein, partial [Planctomycetota bacterium]|nr:biotin/lipoyl-containing protein [Planctomycetota bacterium]
MGKRIEFKLPDIGEGVAEGEITSWKVKPGDVLKEDQIMVEVMTDKATVEIGSPVNGTVREILAAEGQAVPVGSVIIVLEEGAAAGAAPASAPKAPPAQAAPPASPAASRPAQPAHGAPSAPPAAGRPAQPAAARPMQPAQPNAARPMQPAQPAASRPASGATQGGHKPGEPAQPERAPTVERQTAAAAAGAVSAPKSSAAGAPRGGAGREEINFALPDIGEGVAEGEVTRWMVKPGDAVREDQPIVEVMTDKATVEIGSPVDGEVLALLVKEGETVPVGAILLVLGAAAGAGRHVPVPHGSAGKPAGAHTASAAPAPVAAGSSQPELHFEDEAHPTMAGEGGGEPHGGARERAPSPAVARAAQVVGAQAGDGSHGGSHGGSAGSALALADSGLPSRGDGSRRVRAAPATRRFAREAGVDVGALNGSGPDGRILMDDVRAAIAGTSPAARAPGAGMPSAASGASRTGAAAASSAPSATRAGAPPAA